MGNVFCLFNFPIICISYFQIISPFIGAIIKHLSNTMRHTYLIPPKKSFLLQWFQRANNLSRIIFAFRLEITLIQPDSNPSIFDQFDINLAFLMRQTNIYPTSLIIFHWSFNHTPFPILTPLLLSNMVTRIQRIHEPCKPQGRGLGKQCFPQIFGGIEIFQILHEKLGCCQVLEHAFHLSLFVVREDHDFLD